MSAHLENWDCLRYFLSVSRHGTLSGAAHKLQTTAATVSRYIAQLEQNLGQTLFIKHARGYVLTEEGQHLLGQLASVEAGIDSITDHSGTETLKGEIKLAVPESVAHYILLPQFGRFRATCTQLSVELLVNRLEADLARREADLAIRIIQPHQHDFSADYVATKLGQFQFALYANSRLSKSINQGEVDWTKLPFVSWDTTWIKLPMVEWLNDLFPNIRPALRSNSMQAHLAAARGFDAIVMLPTYMGDADEELLQIHHPLPHTQHELWAFYHHNQRGSVKVRETLSFVRKACSKALSRVHNID